MIVQMFRDVMGAAGGVGTRIGHLIVDELDSIIAQFAGMWNPQHNDDGSHGDVTAGSLEVSGDTRLEDVTVAGFIGPLNFGSEAIGDIPLTGESVGDGVGTFTEFDLYPIGGGVIDTSRTALVPGQDLVPDVDDARYLGWLGAGAFVRRWRSLYFSRVVYGPKIVATSAFYERGRDAGVGEWASYTPTWTASGGNPSIGNGSIAGSKMYVGRTVYFTIQLNIGTTTTFGTGLWEFLLPEAPGGVINVNAFAVDNGVRLYLGQCVGLSATTIGLWLSDAIVGTESWAQAGFPFAWGNLDSVQIKGYYRF